MKAGRNRWSRRGYTLLELSLAMGLGMVIAGIGLVLFNQQIAFLRIFHAQDFLTREAPMINNYLVRMIGAADSYKVYPDMETLTANGRPVLENGKVVVLRFEGSAGTARSSVLSFENPGGGQGLYYRVIGADNSIGAPDWALSRKPGNVTFNVEEGILRTYITGPHGERLVYSGTEQL